jgi:hypothetical protein
MRMPTSLVFVRTLPASLIGVRDGFMARASLYALLASAILGPYAALSHAAGSSRESYHHPAFTARTITLHETSRLHLVSHQGTQILNEQGTSSGTLTGPLGVKLRIYYTTATLSFTASPRGGTFSGSGEGSYYVEGHIGHFNGTITITNGTGSYAHAGGSLHATGLILRHQYELQFQATGTMKV